MVKVKNENKFENYPNVKFNLETRYFKLSFIGMYSKVTQNKIEKLCKIFCKNVKLN